MKGQKARSGGGVRPGFEGGQRPLQRRLPKWGFTPATRKRWTIVNLRDLADLAPGTEVTPEWLVEHGLIRGVKDGLKILGEADTFEVALTVRAHAFSGPAAERIRAAGGKAEVI